MKNILVRQSNDKLLLTVQNEIYENQAVLSAAYKYSDKCFINIENIGTQTEILFQMKDDHASELENIALEFENELIDQQVRLNTGREFKVFREQLIKRAFASVNSKS